MTILHLPESFFPANGGGKEVFTLRFAQGLQALGLRNVVAIHGGDASSVAYFHGGIEVRRLPAITHQTPYSNRYTRTVDSLRGFAELLDELKPDVVHFHDQSNGASLSHLREVKRRGIKAVVTFHTPGQVCPQRALLEAGKRICDGRLDVTRCTACQLQSFFGMPNSIAKVVASLGRLDARNPKGKVLKLLSHRHMTSMFKESYREFAQLADKTIVFTKWAKQTYLLNGIEESKLSVIDTGGNPTLEFDKETKRVADAPFELCYIGRCEWIKGIHLLVDAVQQLDKTVPIKVYFYSHSWDRTEYGRGLLRKIEGDPRFERPRMVDNKDLSRTIARHHACVIPSIWPETGPLTVFDAFGSGLPIIGTRSAGIADRVRNGIDGLLFDHGSADGLRSCIEQLLHNNGLYNTLRSNITPNRTMEEVAIETKKLYLSL